MIWRAYDWQNNRSICTLMGAQPTPNRAARAKELSTALDAAAGRFAVNGLAQALVLSCSDKNCPIVGTWVANRLRPEMPPADGAAPPGPGRSPGEIDEKLVANTVAELLDFADGQQTTYRYLQEEALSFVAKLKLYAKAKAVEVQKAAEQVIEPPGAPNRIDRA